jgi:hypothetical protein
MNNIKETMNYTKEAAKIYSKRWEDNKPLTNEEKEIFLKSISGLEKAGDYYTAQNIFDMLTSILYER